MFIIGCYTLKDSDKCLKLGLVYWNEGCVSRRFYCESLHFQMHDLTHCKNDMGDLIDMEQNGTLAAEIFYK